MTTLTTSLSRRAPLAALRATLTRTNTLARSRRLLGAVGTAGLLLLGSGLQLAAPTHAAPSFQTRGFQVLSVGADSLVARGPLGRVFTVTVDPAASLRHRFNGPFSLANLSQIQPNDRIQMNFVVTSPGYLTAYSIQDYSLQIAYSAVKGYVISVAPDGSSFTLHLTRAFGGSNAAFAAGQTVTVYTPDPWSIPVANTPCGNAGCLDEGMYVELYGLSDRPNRNISDPRAMVQVAPYAPALVEPDGD